MISHVALNVSNMAASEAFYALVLGPLGFKKADAVEGQYARLTNGKNAVLVLLPHRGNQPTNCHRHGLGLNHLAFQAPSRDIVDRITAQMLANGHAPLSQGTVDTGYRGPYYTASFLDPDGIMIEVVYHREGYFSPTSDNLFPQGESGL